MPVLTVNFYIVAFYFSEKKKVIRKQMRVLPKYLWMLAHYLKLEQIIQNSFFVLHIHNLYPNNTNNTMRVRSRNLFLI